VDRPLELAEHLLATDGWTREHIDAQLASAQTRSIRLAEPLPVVVAYLTARVDESGTVFFYRDIYGRDARFENPAQ
jgi:murein L,D-transpeptidase YcbB/YkuD